MNGHEEYLYEKMDKLSWLSLSIAILVNQNTPTILKESICTLADALYIPHRGP